MQRQNFDASNYINPLARPFLTFSLHNHLMESTYVISAILVMLIEYCIKFNGKYSETTNAEQLHVCNMIGHFLS